MTEKCGEVVIRDAVPADAERIREIYDHYVRHTAISFEYETPTRDAGADAPDHGAVPLPGGGARRCGARLRLRGALQGEGGL